MTSTKKSTQSKYYFITIRLVYEPIAFELRNHDPLLTTFLCLSFLEKWICQPLVSIWNQLLFLIRIIIGMPRQHISKNFTHLLNMNFVLFFLTYFLRICFFFNNDKSMSLYEEGKMTFFWWNYLSLLPKVWHTE